MEAQNYSKYTIEQLKSALSMIDRNSLPERTKVIEDYLEKRMSDTDYLLEYESNSSYFNFNIPSSIIKDVWIKYTIASVIIALPLGICVGLVFAFMGLESMVLLAGLQIMIGFMVSFLAINKAMGEKYEKFEIVFLRNKDI